MIIDVDDDVRIVDLKDYPPQFGLKEGQTGKIMSLFKYNGHTVAQVLPDDERKLKYNTQYRTYPLSLSRLARLAAILLALFLPAWGHAQPIVIGGIATDLEVLEARKVLQQAEHQPGTLTVGSQFTTSEVAKAKELLQAIEPKKLAIKVGEFEVIEPAKTVAGPLLWVSQDESLIERITVQKDQPFALWMQRRGEAAPRLHLFEPKPFTWAILVAKKNGAGSIVIVRNGDDTAKPPAIVDRIDAVTGDPKPVPPQPQPQPQPDEPKPDDKRPTPIPLPGLRVLIVYESSELSKLPSEQVQSLTAKQVLDYLDAKCIKDPAGNPEYRKFDKDTDVRNMSVVWQQAMSRVLNGDGIQKEGKATEFPWLLVSNGRTGYEGPLPKKVADLLTILKKHGGE